MVIFRSAQPVIFYHSSRGLGRCPNKHSAFVYTEALLAEACSWKRCDGTFWKNFSFLLCIKWASNVRGYPLPRTTCWGRPKPRYTQKVFCGCAFVERFPCVLRNHWKDIWFQKSWVSFILRMSQTEKTCSKVALSFVRKGNGSTCSGRIGLSISSKVLRWGFTPQSIYLQYFTMCIGKYRRGCICFLN